MKEVISGGFPTGPQDPPRYTCDNCGADVDVTERDWYFDPIAWKCPDCGTKYGNGADVEEDEAIAICDNIRGNCVK